MRYRPWLVYVLLAGFLGLTSGVFDQGEASAAENAPPVLQEKGAGNGNDSKGNPPADDGKKPADEGRKSAKVFRFGGGEKISIQVARENSEEGLQVMQVVTSDGFVSSVRFGLINIMDLTIEEASKAIEKKYREVTGFRAPIVAISLLAVPDHRVYVQGEVEAPKMVVLPFEMDLTLASVLAEAGGFKEDADLTRIKILRRLAGGEVRLDVVDATGFAKRGVNFSGPTLKSGDNVIVPRAEVFMVTGEVERPGFVSRKSCRVPHGQPVRLSHVLSATGGLTAKADRKAVTVSHVDEQGRRSTKTYDANVLEKDAAAEDPEMVDGDRVYVAPGEGIMIMGAVSAPGIYYIPVGPSTLSRLIGLAGGLATTAKSKEVRLHRKSATGKPLMVDMRSVIEEGRRDLDQELVPGDMIFVPGSQQ